MKRVVIGLVGVIAIVVLSAAIAQLFGPSTPAYTVPEVQAGLWRAPRAWMGRTVTIQGWILEGGNTDCTAPIAARCRTTWVRISPSTSSISTSPPFDVAIPRHIQPESLYASQLLVFLHRLPLVGTFIPPLVGSRTVRVRLASPPAACWPGDSLCIEGISIP